MIYNSTEELVGNTPLVKINHHIHGLKNIDMYAKLEYLNPYGSVKDRIAKNMLAPYVDEIVENKKTILEASSGNTSKALAVLAGVYGVDMKTITNRVKVPEVRQILQTLGVDLEELPGTSDCHDPNDPNDFVTYTEKLAAGQPEKYHYTDQFLSKLNLEAHIQTGKEIANDLNHVDYFAGCLGTCGTTMGAGQYLKDQGMDTKVIGIVADLGQHIPGSRNKSELWEIGFFKNEFYETIVPGNNQQAVDGMLTLARHAGILAGPTTGVNYAATVEYLKTIDDSLTSRKSVVFIACDRLEPYMSYLKKHRPEIFSQTTSERPRVASLADETINKHAPISPETMAEKASSPTPPLVIDIRGQFAFSLGHLEGSINIVDELFTSMIEEGKTLPQDKEIVITCRTGDLSQRYAAFLCEQGYNAASLEGGIMAWKKQRKPLVKIQ